MKSRVEVIQDRNYELLQRGGKAVNDMIDAIVILGDPSHVPEEEVVPGETRTLRADLRVGADQLGVLLGRLPATRRWERADQDLLELFASEIAVGVRNRLAIDAGSPGGAASASPSYFTQMSRMAYGAG